MHKRELMDQLLASLEADLKRLQAANASASDGATHSETRAETKWDTCGLEASYLARGHAEQFKELATQVHELRSLNLAESSGPIGQGALIEVFLNGEVNWFFLLPCGGGKTLEMKGQEVTVITPESPIGTILSDKVAGDAFIFRAPPECRIISVQ